MKMSFVKYKNTNNASSLLIADITASQTTILITDGDQSLFPSEFPFLLTIEHLDSSENVILREIVKVLSSNQNSFTVERSAGICVQDDTASNRVQDNTAHAFFSGDRISLYWTAEQVQDIQNSLESKANQDSIANVYDNTTTYSVGDIVVYNGDRYVCQTAVSTAEDFDSSKRIKVNIQYSLDEQQTQIDNIESQISTLGGLMKVDVLLVGGGGGGGGGQANGQTTSGGGGGGQVKIIYGYAIACKSIGITIGTGGSGGSGINGVNGGTSKFGNIYAIGGGGGGRYFQNGVMGANGGGGGACSNATIHDGGLGMEGGNIGAPGNCNHGGGGAGAGGDGGRNVVAWCNYDYAIARGLGGIGVATCFSGSLKGFGGGGQGAIGSGIAASWGDGRCYGGGQSTPNGNSCNGCPGCPNTGGGGSGTRGTLGGAGGSGIVIVRYPTNCSFGIKTATGGTITTPTINGIQYVVHTFTSSGTFCITATA